MTVTDYLADRSLEHAAASSFRLLLHAGNGSLYVVFMTDKRLKLTQSLPVGLTFSSDVTMHYRTRR